MERFLEFRHDKDAYVIFASLVAPMYFNFASDDGPDIYELIDGIEVIKNGVKAEEFGTTFVGHKLNVYDLLCGAVAAYINGDQTFKWTYVHEALRIHKAGISSSYTSTTPSFIEAGGQIIPRFAVNPSQELLSLNAYSVSKKTGLVENTWYNHYDTALVLNADRSVLTDIEAFAESALCQAEEDIDTELVIIGN